MLAFAKDDEYLEIEARLRRSDYFDEQDIDRLTAASAPGLPAYPYGFLEDWSGLDVWTQLGTGTRGNTG